MLKALKALVRQWRCRRHRWRSNRNHPGSEWCDLCGARRTVRVG